MMAGLVAGVTGLTACEDQDAADRVAASEAIQTSCAVLERVHHEGIAPARAEWSQEAYEEAIRVLQAKARVGLDDQQCAASALLARSYAGLAGIRSSEILDMERQVLNLAERIRVVVDAMHRLHGGADVLVEYDPAEEREDLDDQRSKVNTRLASLRKEQRQLDARLSQLQDKASQARSRYEALRLKADSLSDEAKAAYGAERRYELVAQSREVRRQAAEHQRDLSETLALIDARQPELERTQHLIDQDERYLETLKDAEDLIAVRERGRREEADARRATAAELGEEVSSLYVQLSQIVEQGLGDAYLEALSQTDEAVQSSRTALQKASRDGKASAGTAVARYHQMQGALLWQQARGISTHIAALEMMQSTPGLPKQQAAAANLVPMQSLRDELLDRATSAFSDAIDVLDHLGSRDVDPRTLANLTGQLWQVRSITSGGEFSADQPVEALPDEVYPEETDAQDDLAQQTDTSPLDTVFELHRCVEDGDYDAMSRLLYADSAEAQRMVDASVMVLKSENRLNCACRGAFGMTLEECVVQYFREQAEQAGLGEEMVEQMMSQAPGTGMGALDMSMVPAGELTEADFDVQITGDQATVTYLPTDVPISMIFVNGQWFVHQDLTAAGAGGMMLNADTLSETAAMLSRVADRVQDGEVTTVEELLTALSGL